MEKTVAQPAPGAGLWKRVLSDMWRARYLYLIILPGILYFAIFQYGPMSGLVLAFKKYNAHLGVWGSPWVGMKNFARIFSTPAAISAIRNTFEINLSRLIFQFPFAIILALLLNEMRGRRVKRVYQTVYTFPHFLSWITVSSILMDFLSNGGAVNSILASLGLQRINFLSSTALFRPLLYFTHNWKDMGWNSIIYIAAIAAIDPSLYEAATVDGASRWQRTWHITLPGLKSIIAIQFILALGGILATNSDLVILIYNPATYETADVIGSYTYRIGIQNGKYSYTTAVGLFMSIIGFTLTFIANKFSNWLTGFGLW